MHSTVSTLETDLWESRYQPFGSVLASFEKFGEMLDCATESEQIQLQNQGGRGKGPYP